MPTGLSAWVSGIRVPKARPTPREATLAWLFGIVLVIAVGLGVGAMAKGLAVSEGLSRESALAEHVVAAYVLLVGDLSRRHLRRLSFRPPAPEDS